VNYTHLECFFKRSSVSILKCFKPKNTIPVPTIWNSLLLNSYRDVEVTYEEFIDIMAEIPRMMDILI